MTLRLQAINANRPRIDLGKTVQKPELVRYLADRTNLNKGMVDLVVSQLCDAVIFFNATGRGVKFEGLGTYLPAVDLDGTFSVEHRLDNTIKTGLNASGIFTGEIVNKENIGKTPDELVAIWDARHPDDKVSN